MPGQELPWKPPPPLRPVTGTACRKGALSGWRGRAPRQPRLLPVRTWLQAPGARTAAQGPSACRRPGAPGEGVCHRGDLARHRTAGVETRDPCPSPRIAAAPRWTGAHRRHRWPQWPWPGGDCWLGRARPGDHGPHAESRPAGGSGGRAVDGTPHPGQGTAALTLPVTGRLRRPPGGLTAAWWLSAPPRGRARGPRRAGVCVTVGHGRASGSAVVPGLPARFGSAVALAAPTRSRLRQAVSPAPGRVPACTPHWGLRGNRPVGFTLAAGTTVLWACMSAPFAHTVHTRTAQYKRACMHGCMCTCLCTHTHMHPQHVHIHVRAVHTCTHLQDVHTFLHTVCTLLMNIRMHKRRCTYLRAHAHTSHTDTHACSDRTSPSPSSRWSQAVPSGL